MAFISDVAPGRIDWVLEVRPIRLWIVLEHKNNQLASSVEMIFLDEKLDRIHANVRRSLLTKYHPLLEEGVAYRIEKVSVGANDVKFPTTPHRFKLNFTNMTKVIPIENDKIPKNHFQFMAFPEILASTRDDQIPDVIGHLVQRDSLKEHDKHGRQTQYIQFNLEDLNRNVIQCTFWGSYAEELNLNLDQHASSDPPILVVQLGKLKRFQGSVGISNAFHGTRVFFNSDLPEITAYRNSMATQSEGLTRNVTQIVTPPLSLSEELVQTPKMTISQLLGASDVGFAAVAVRVIEIEDQYGWLYDSCNRCMRKVSKVGTHFYCKNPKCSRMVIGVPRFKVEMRVMDATGIATFVLFNRVVSDYLGKSAQTLIETLVSSTPYPDDFNAFFGKELFFKVAILEGNITQNWQHFAVKRMTDDAAIIKSFLDKHLAPNTSTREAIEFADGLTELPDIISLIPPNEHDDMLASTDHATDVVVTGTGKAVMHPLAGPVLAANPGKRFLDPSVCDVDDDDDLPSGSGTKTAKISTEADDITADPSLGLVTVKIEPGP